MSLLNSQRCPDWESVRQEWDLRPGVTYLNHGSFGPSPKSVIAAREQWSRRLEAEPMDFFVREMEPALDSAAETLGRFLGTRETIFCSCPTRRSP